VPYREQDPGGSGAIKGQITDNTQCNQLAGVTVSDDQGHSTVSDPYGNYTLSGVNSGKITITAKKSGFTSQSKTLNVGSKAATLKFSLQIN
jgi:iron complex outermembrane receptor protein